MTRYRFTGLTDKGRLVETMIDQSQMDRGEAAFVVDHNIERCVEVWDGLMLCGYFIIAERDGVRSLHGYKLCKGRARNALRVALHLLKDEKGVIYSGHRPANQKVNRLLKLLGFRDTTERNGFQMMEKKT